MKEAVVQGWLKAKIKRELGSRGMSYADLIRALSEIGVKETEVNLRGKMSRGTFGANFFVQCLSAMGVATLEIDLLKYARTMETEPSFGGISRADLELAVSDVRLAWSQVPPKGNFDEVPLPYEHRSRHFLHRNLNCGNCDTRVFDGFSLASLRSTFEGTRAVGRCSACRAYIQLPGSLVDVVPTRTNAEP
jgi:hypothetical protein